MKRKDDKGERGITLIALVVTIVILIILATISVNLILNRGLIHRTQSGAELHKRESAREKLSIVLGGAGLEKRINQEYNQDDFLDGIILKDIPGAKILGDIVIVDGYGFEIDRSVPKIGKYVGREDELVFPELSLDTVIAEDNKTATIAIKAKEEKNGINKIEIWRDGFVIETYTYDNTKEEITETYTVNRNGRYAVKVYAELSRTEITGIDKLVANIKYSPNGNKEYKKEHIVQVNIDKTVDIIKSIKYQWTNSLDEPKESSFTESCNDGAKISKNGVTGQWYLWTLVETDSGNKRIERSEAFYLDNTAPTVTLTATPVSETAFTLTATAHDNEVEIEKYEFYVGQPSEKITIQSSEEKVNCEVTDKAMGNYPCWVIVTDTLGNRSVMQECSNQARTKMYAWDTYSVVTKNVYVRLPTQTDVEVNTSALQGETMSTYTFSATSGFSGTPHTATTDSCYREWGNNWQGGMVNYRYSLISSTTIWYFKSRTGRVVTMDVLRCQRQATKEKGTTRNIVEYDSDPEKFPENGESDGIWYVRRNSLG